LTTLGTAIKGKIATCQIGKHWRTKNNGYTVVNKIQYDINKDKLSLLSWKNKITIGSEIQIE